MIAFDTAPAAGDVSPGLLGFLVVAGLGFALYLLVKSMRKRISKIEVPSEAELRRQRNEARASAPSGSSEPVTPVVPPATPATPTTPTTPPNAP
ncbi:hypothetical protein ACLQ2R_27905 [Streptosporangium sp. DT93]|uniref:hypothetical protein n=1 Tax=Streptosporangium sp. DT93 TaxID=3393428 RepID=UPI003CED6ED0